MHSAKKELLVSANLAPFARCSLDLGSRAIKGPQRLSHHQPILLKTLLMDIFFQRQDLRIQNRTRASAMAQQVKSVAVQT